MKKFLKPILAILLVILAVLIFYYRNNPLVPKLSINNHIITYETAVTEAEVTLGLSGRDPLPENHGMLFIYNRKEQYQFWMKDMKFPLDLIWIDDNTVIDITKNAPTPIPAQQLPLYAPKRPVNRVLELNAGAADKLGIKEGDTVQYLRR